MTAYLLAKLAEDIAQHLLKPIGLPDVNRATAIALVQFAQKGTAHLTDWRGEAVVLDAETYRGQS